MTAQLAQTLLADGLVSQADSRHPSKGFSERTGSKVRPASRRPSEFLHVNTAVGENANFHSTAPARLGDSPLENGVIPFPTPALADAVDPILVKNKTRLAPFVATLARGLESLAFADVTLCADGVDIPAHRLILSCHTDYFAQMFEPSAGNAAIPVRVELPGKSAESVRALLRVLYFEATPREVLSAEPLRSLQILELAKAWCLYDIVGSCIEFVKFDVHDLDTLEHLCSSISLDSEVQILRDICQERLRVLRDNANAHAAARCIEEAISADVTAKTYSRWPAASGGDQWSAPVSCPRGFGH